MPGHRGQRPGLPPGLPPPRRSRTPAAGVRLEAERALEEGAAALRVGAVGAHLLEALDRVLARALGVLGHERLVVGLDHPQLEPETLRIREDERAGQALAASEPLG